MNWPALLLGIFWVTSLFGQSGTREDFPPPFNFHVDSVTLLATWQSPRIVLLHEDFEEDVFPPDGWTDSTLGEGWQGVSSPVYQAWEVPDHPGKFALANDDAAGGMNNGSEDLLFTPVMDLTVADSFMLTFDSYFDAGWGQEAYVKYSLDGGESWQLLLDVPAKLEWQKLVVDLSEFSGEDGESTFQLLFHAEDNNWASGWALDNVVVSTDDIGEPPVDYKIFIESRQVAQEKDTSYQYYFEHSTSRYCGILAHYSNGVSDTMRETIQSAYLAPPESLVGNAPDDVVILHWSNPSVPLHPYKRDFLDSVFCFPSVSPHIEGGCVSDGTYVYSVFEDSDSVYKYDFFGNIIERFNIPGIPGLYDLTYNDDDGYYYGAKGTSLIYIMDFENHFLAGTLIAPVPVRGIAYDKVNNAFWANNWSSDLTLFDASGYVLNSFPVPNYGNFYGLAYDMYDDGGPYIWAFSRDGGGNLVIQIDVELEQETGYYLDLNSISINGGQAAGLYFNINPLLGGVMLYGNIQNDVFFGYGYLEIIFTTTMPEHLLGFNIYKDDNFLAYSPGYAPPFSVNSFMDTLTEPAGSLMYEVTAVYDMTEYGFPGDSAESEREGPAMVVSPLPILELDYVEDWEYISYDWIIPEGEWQISQETGNDAPAAVFMPDSLLTDYESSLKSYLFLAYDLQKINLAYDIYLASNQPTGNEILEVQVLDFMTGSWNTLMAYSNSEGTFDWRRDTIEITESFNGNEFRIRFMAMGENSAAIEFWAIDNIALTHSCLPPTDVEAILGPEPEDSIRITWQEPWPALAEWWQWDDGVQYSSLSAGYGKDNWFACATRWDSEQLADLKGAYLTAIGFIPCELTTYYKIAVWTGEDKHLIYNQAVENQVLNQWNIILLNKPVPVDITKDLLVGYQSSQFTGYPHSVDDGPAIDGYGNLYKYGEWTTLLEINPEMDFNWNIKAYFERDSIPVENYELYRSIDGSDYEMIAEPPGEEYLDAVFNWNAEYCYALKAVYPYEVCVSGYSEESCILAVSSDPVEISDNSYIQVYPNPSSGDFFIESSEEMNQISIYNTSGMMIYEEEGSDVMKKIHLDVEPGIYFLKVRVSENAIYKKLIIH